MTLDRYVVVIKRKNGLTEVLSNTMDENEKECNQQAEWLRTRYLGVEVVVAKCVIEVPDPNA